MKKLAILFLLLALGAHADTRSSQIIARIGATIGAWESYVVDFALDASGQQLTGRYVVSGAKYYLHVEGVEVYCDGRTRWEVNVADREVIVDRVDPRDKSILSNPTQVFAFSDEAFTHSYAGRLDGLDAVTLRPAQEGNIRQIRLLVDPASGLPRSLEYRIEGASEPVCIAVSAIRPVPDVPAAQFVFDRTKYKGYEVIDFR